MSQTSEMRRLALHAAEKLRSERGTAPTQQNFDSDRIRALWARRRADAIAMTYAEAILEMLAACMDDGEPLGPPTERDERGRFRPRAVAE